MSVLDHAALDQGDIGSDLPGVHEVVGEPAGRLVLEQLRRDRNTSGSGLTSAPIEGSTTMFSRMTLPAAVARFSWTSRPPQ
jgi:hypothetical protein